PAADRTTVLRPVGRLPGETTTQVLGAPGEQTRVIRRPGIDDTQVIRLPGHERARHGLAEAAGERTTVVRPPSIAGAESPNFAEDPTGQIMPLVVDPDEPVRTMTVMNVERPPEPRKSPESED